MPVVKTITSPHRFPERILIFGEGGSGKTSAILNMARYMPYAQFWVHDTDVSFAYDRGLALEYQDVDERGNVHVLMSSDWDEYVENANKIKADADPSVDVLVTDNVTFPWQWVQNQHIQAQYGVDVDQFQADLKRQFKDDNQGYAKALSEAMQWPIINKKFDAGVYQRYHKWRGHAFMIAMAKTLRGEKDEDLQAQFKVHGAMPSGQKNTSYVMRTNILMAQGTTKNTWRYSTTKDQGHPKQEKQPMEEFAMDYLVAVAGWQVEKQRVA